jgi:hypothetical protein
MEGLSAFHNVDITHRNINTLNVFITSGGSFKIGIVFNNILLYVILLYCYIVILLYCYIVMLLLIIINYYYKTFFYKL